MWYDIKRMYDAGTFALGQKLYSVETKMHTIRYKKPCDICDSTGYVICKGIEFKCPQCKNVINNKDIKEMRVSNSTIKVKSIIKAFNENCELEQYFSDKEFLGHVIQKQSDGSSNYFSTKEEAQAYCDKWNLEHHVESELKKYESMMI